MKCHIPIFFSPVAGFFGGKRPQIKQNSFEYLIATAGLKGALEEEQMQGDGI